MPYVWSKNVTTVTTLQPVKKLNPDEIDCILHALARYTSGAKMKRIMDKLEALNARI